MAYLYVLEAASLFVGDNGPDNDKGLIIESLKLPGLEEKTQEFQPGGSFNAIEIRGLGIKPLMASFKVKGWDPQSMSQFGLNGAAPVHYTAYGAVRNKNGAAAVEVKAVMIAAMTKAEGDEFKAGDLYGTTFETREMLHYELYFNKQEKFYFDFFARTWRVDGTDQRADVNAILRVAG
jgi:P2 family phage contractile tail tube protein